MWDTILIILIVAACAFFIGRRFYRQFTGRQSGCGCGCGSGGCDGTSTPSDSCCQSKADFPRKDKA